MIAKSLMSVSMPRIAALASPAPAVRASAQRPSDGELLQRCIEGDQHAWRQLIDRYGRLVCATARECGLGVADSEDVMQVVFARLFRALPSLRDHARLAPWLITTSRRESWRMVQRNRSSIFQRLTDGSIDRHHDSVDPCQDEQTIVLEQQHLIRQALMQLPARDQRLLHALFLDDRNESYDAIATRLDMRPGSIGPTRARAFKRLEKILIEMGLGPVSSEERSGVPPMKPDFMHQPARREEKQDQARYSCECTSCRANERYQKREPQRSGEPELKDEISAWIC